MWMKLILLALSIICFLFLIGTMISFSPKFVQKIKGNKIDVLSKISELVEKCAEKREEGKKENYICFEVEFECTQEIKKSDVEELVKVKDFIVKNDLGKNGKIVIKIVNNIIFLEKIEYESIGS